MHGHKNIHTILAILAAALFGASAPVAKLLLGKIEPIPLAALVYLGSGVILCLFRSVLGKRDTVEAPLTRRDVPWLTGAIISGGVAAPIALMIGLQKTPASTASLLLNFEGVATALVAVWLFREAVGRRIWWAIVCVTAASILLSWDGSDWDISIGAFCVLGACLLWGFDNNFTRNISSKDPLTIVAVKGLIAGSFSLCLGILTGSKMPSLSTSMVAMLFGSVSYGLSIVFFILAMRGLGAARTGALFGTAPFVGALLSLLIFRSMPGMLFFVSAPIMIFGAVLLLSEDHAHEHRHIPLEHDHRHHHDEHHNHEHEDVQSDQEPHSHPHVHAPIMHTHSHGPDDHHRHGH